MEILSSPFTSALFLFLFFFTRLSPNKAENIATFCRVNDFSIKRFTMNATTPKLLRNSLRQTFSRSHKTMKVFSLPFFFSFFQIDIYFTITNIVQLSFNVGYTFSMNCKIDDKASPPVRRHADCTISKFSSK